MRAYIPSYRRAGEVSAHLYFEDYKIVIPQNQAEDYLKYHCEEELIIIDDKKDGNVAKKRNAILDIMREEEGHGIIADDDFQGIMKIDTKEKFGKEEIEGIFTNLILMAYDSGAKYVGLNNTKDKIKYRGDLQPFSFTKAFYGTVGIIEDGMRYDESFVRGEDVDFYMKQCIKNKIVIRDNRYTPIHKEGNKKTGIGKVDEECVMDFIRLKKRYGSKHIRLRDNGVIKGVSQLRTGL